MNILEDQQSNIINLDKMAKSKQSNKVDQKIH